MAPIGNRAAPNPHTRSCHHDECPCYRGGADSLRTALTTDEERLAKSEAWATKLIAECAEEARAHLAAKERATTAEAERDQLADAIRWAAQPRLQELASCITNESMGVRCEQCEGCTIWKVLLTTREVTDNG